MRRVGAILVLSACAALQLPWFTCHSDCRDACLPVWDLAAHHCHDADAAGHGLHRCLTHRHADDAGGATDPAHGPGRHDLQPQASRRPVSFEATSPGVLPTPAPPPVLAAPCAVRPTGVPEAAAPDVDSGPPGRIDCVRLLL